MAKKCIICDAEATYRIKDSTEFYCNECAAENFNDLSYLKKVAEEAERLKEAIKEKMNEPDSED
jgi:uncharacterized Zn ribbon protein